MVFNINPPVSTKFIKGVLIFNFFYKKTQITQLNFCDTLIDKLVNKAGQISGRINQRIGERIKVVRVVTVL